MVNSADLIKRDLNHIWHPATQMKDFETYPPFVIQRAEGSYLYTEHGPVIDAISSWWCKSLGHGHPEVITAIKNQLDCFEHVITADTTHQSIVELSEELTSISKKQHVFFASDGSSAVEIAMKLALQAMQIKGNPERNQFAALKHSYHGETLGTLSISDLGIYKKPFEHMGLTCHFLQQIPYVPNQDSLLWNNCEPDWEFTLAQLEKIKDKLCAIVVEPIVQGAGGMLIYSQDYLKKLAAFAKQNDLYLIADEIMTGFGRTGKWLASEHAGIEPDLICLSKGLTSGSLPLSCVLIDKSIYELFYADYHEGKSFLHSHTYSGNPLAVAAALATIQVMRRENINQQAVDLGLQMKHYFTEIAEESGVINNVRSIGAIVAGDLKDDHHERLGLRVYREALKHGALLRPMGKTIYWLPPLNTKPETIADLARITLQSIDAVYNQR